MTAMEQGAGRLGRRLAGMVSELTVEKIAAEGMENAARNQPLINKGQSIAALGETPLAEGATALVIAAGPSLHRSDTAAAIRQSGFDGIIIATESSMAWCLRNGIVPDLTVTVDTHPDRIVRWFGDPDLDQAALEADDYFARQDMDPRFCEDQLKHNRELIELVDRHGPDIRLAVASSASQAVVGRAMDVSMPCYWWNPFYDDYDRPDSLTRRLHEMNRLPCINAGGNVGTACWVIAHAILGKTRIGLLGMDFGYYADTTYRQTQYYRELVALVGEDRLDDVFVPIRNPHTDTDFFTDPPYLWYRDSFLEMAAMAAEDGVRTINCTRGGILFGEPLEWADLADFAAAGQ